MAPTRLVVITAGAALATLLAGCASAPSAVQPRTSGQRAGTSLPADSPLADCVDPAPPAPRPVDTGLARSFSHGRVRAAFSLDDGRFRAVPARSGVRPRVSAALALCNLLAAVTTGNFPVGDAVAAHGMSFGLGLVSVSDSVLKTGRRSYLAGGEQVSASLAPYHRRLAWIAVITPDTITSCPAMTSAPSPRTTPSPKPLPPYQILAIDADTGAAGIIYSARTYALCGEPGYRPASVAPAVEQVSVPWTLVERGPGPKSATISYRPRPCDSRDLGTFYPTGQPVVLADRDHAGLVRVGLERTLTSCGPAVPVEILLRSSTLATDLPRHLAHAPLGAMDAGG